MTPLLFLLLQAQPAQPAGEDWLPPPPTPGHAQPTPDPGSDTRDKIIFKFDLGYQFYDALSSGDKPLALTRPPRNDTDAQAADLASHVDYLASDHVLGTEGLGWKHLRTYYNGHLLLRLPLTDQDAGVQAAVLPTAYLKPGDNASYDVRAGYAEINGFADEGPGSKAYVRAGRQFRYGAGIATFDGATLGYATPVFEAAAWGGRRSPRFLDDLDPGVVGGADFTVHLLPLVDVPIDLSLDYLGYGVGDTSTHVLVLNGRWLMRHGGKLLYSVTTANAEGIRLYAALTEPIGTLAQLKLSYDLKAGRDLVYDFVAGFGLNASRYFTLPDIEPRSRIGIRFDHQLGPFEYAAYVNLNLVHSGDPIEGTQGWIPPTAFDATYEELGVVVRLGDAVVTPEAEYRVRFVQRVDEDPGTFLSTSQAGEQQFQEGRADLRWRPARGWSLLGGGVYRVYDWVTRYVAPGETVTVSNDTTLAFEVALDYAVARGWKLQARYEAGQDSSVFAPELGFIQSGTFALGGRF